jgi:DNA polymerase III epsilon subunit-like protein
MRWVYLSRSSVPSVAEVNHKSALPCGPQRLHRGLRKAFALARVWKLFAPSNEPKNEPKTSD